MLRPHDESNEQCEDCAAGPRRTPAAQSCPRRPCYPAHHRLDLQVPGGEGGGDAVAAVAHDEPVALSGEAHGRGLPALLEPLTVTLDRRRAEAARTALADANPHERHPDRCLLLGAHASSLLSTVDGDGGSRTRYLLGASEALC